MRIKIDIKDEERQANKQWLVSTVGYYGALAMLAVTAWGMVRAHLRQHDTLTYWLVAAWCFSFVAACLYRERQYATRDRAHVKGLSGAVETHIRRRQSHGLH